MIVNLFKCLKETNRHKIDEPLDISNKIRCLSFLFIYQTMVIALYTLGKTSRVAAFNIPQKVKRYNHINNC